MRNIFYVVLSLIILGIAGCGTVTQPTDANEPTHVNMDKFNRTIVFYEAGVDQHMSNSKFQGCSYLRLAIQESRRIGDNGQTESQIRPTYEKLCYTGEE